MNFLSALSVRAPWTARAVRHVALRAHAVSGLLMASGALALSGCAADAPTAAAPFLISQSAAPSPFRGAAFILDVSTLQRTVKVSAPVAPMTASSTISVNGAQHSLLGADVIDVSVSNYVAGMIGAVAPGKVLVTFDLTLYNKLVGLRLTTPTFPVPPAGLTGVEAFPLEVSVLTTAGRVGVSGSEINVTAPRSGVAVASADWDGAPHNFFNDVGCNASSNDCFRFEPFGILEPQTSSARRKVGFLLDPTVGDLRVRVILAADLQSTR